MTDYLYVDCEEYREALSARLDGEECAEDAAQSPGRHLEFCRECASWYANAAVLTLWARNDTATGCPDVADAVLTEVRRRTTAEAALLRLPLGAVGVGWGASALLATVLDGRSEQTAR